MAGTFGPSGLFSRWIGALFIVLATYNPSGVSYYHWLVNLDDPRWSLKALVGLIMVILNMFFLLVSLRALRRSGLLAAAIFCVVLVWALVDNGYLQALSFWSWITVTLTLIGSILGVGVSWGHIRGRLSGQADSNDVTL
jgi:glucan phosphoethanolaminetransferase (alkaline phosphatase superfamily)